MTKKYVRDRGSGANERIKLFQWIISKPKEKLQAMYNPGNER